MGLPIQFIGCMALVFALGVIGLGAMMLNGGESLYLGIIIAVLLGIAGVVWFLVERGRYRAGVERCVAALKRTMGVPASGPASRSASAGT